MTRSSSEGSRPRSSAQMMQRLRGKFRSKPQLVVNLLECDAAVCPGKRSALTTFELGELMAHVVVPVDTICSTSSLRQITLEGWERQLSSKMDDETTFFHPPLLLSARDKWYLKDDVLEVFDSAYVVDGAKRLENAVQSGLVERIPVMVVLGLNPSEELLLRKKVNRNINTIDRVEWRERIGTTAPRLVIGVNRVIVKITSDPFVVPTSMGYAPAILVRRDDALYSEYVLVGAKSIAKELELLRAKHETLIGCRVSIQKESEARSAKYKLETNN